MNPHVPVLRNIVADLLRDRPLYGARLKPLVAEEFLRRTGMPFVQAFWDKPKFSLVLRELGDLVEVAASGGGDVIVSLRADTSRDSLTPPFTLDTGSPQIFVRPALWHAFTNPDLSRRRFYHRLNHEIVHYVEGAPGSGAFSEKVASDPDFVEISPIPPVQHIAWMSEFVSTHPLPEATRNAATKLLSLEYSSQLQRAFSAALESSADAWRYYRTGNVVNCIRQWADQREVDVQGIRVESSPSLAPAPKAVLPSATQGDLRAELHALIDVLDESDLERVLVPASVLARVTRGRQR